MFQSQFHKGHISRNCRCWGWFMDYASYMTGLLFILGMWHHGKDGLHQHIPLGSKGHQGISQITTSLLWKPWQHTRSKLQSFNSGSSHKSIQMKNRTKVQPCWVSGLSHIRNQAQLVQIVAGKVGWIPILTEISRDRLFCSCTGCSETADGEKGRGVILALYLLRLSKRKKDLLPICQWVALGYRQQPLSLGCQSGSAIGGEGQPGSPTCWWATRCLGNSSIQIRLWRQGNRDSASFSRKP